MFSGKTASTLERQKMNSDIQVKLFFLLDDISEESIQAILFMPLDKVPDFGDNLNYESGKDEKFSGVWYVKNRTDYFEEDTNNLLEIELYLTKQNNC